MTTPFVSKRAPIYADVPDEKWNDWRWQLSNRLNSVEDIEKVIPLTERVKLRFNADFFNVLNRVNFNAPNGTLGTRLANSRMPVR